MSNVKPLPFSLTWLNGKLSYNHLTGVFTNNSTGVVVGCLGDRGYVTTKFYAYEGYGKWYMHRLAWFMYYGEEPKGFIDHINGLKHDNRIENLRCVDHITNMNNQHKARCHNMLGILGVSKTRCGTFQAEVRVNGKRNYLGTFKTLAEASTAYESARNSTIAIGDHK